MVKFYVWISCLNSLTFFFPLKFPNCRHPFVRNKECDRTGEPLLNTHLNDFLNNATVVSSIFITSTFQITRDANPAGGNSSFIFIVSVKPVRIYRFKLAYVVLHIAVKESVQTHF